MKTMTLKEFRKLAKERGLVYDTDTWHACKMVLVGGKTATFAADVRCINISSVTRALKKLKAEPKHCENCGQRLPWGVV